MLEVAAGGEGPALPAQQGDRDVGVAVDVAPDLRQLAMAVGVEGIELARAGQDDLEDARRGRANFKAL